MPMGVANMTVDYRNQSFSQPVFVVPGNSPCLVSLKLNWSDIFSVTT